MPTCFRLLAPLALGASLAWPAWSASTAASSASDSVGASVGSVSGSLQGSSASSGQAVAVAPGDYQLIEVAAVPGEPGQLRLALQAVAHPGPAGRLLLQLPAEAYAAGRLGPGDRVHAQHRPYGLAFARADTRETFFLVLTDAWYRELQTVPVRL